MFATLHLELTISSRMYFFFLSNARAHNFFAFEDIHLPCSAHLCVSSRLVLIICKCSLAYNTPIYLHPFAGSKSVCRLADKARFARHTRYNQTQE